MRAYTNTGCEITIYSGAADDVGDELAMYLPSGLIATGTVDEANDTHSIVILHDGTSVRLYWSLDDCPDRPVGS